MSGSSWSSATVVTTIDTVKTTANQRCTCRNHLAQFTPARVLMFMPVTLGVGSTTDASRFLTGLPQARTDRCGGEP